MVSRSLRMVTLAGVLCLALAACGGDGGSDSDIDDAAAPDSEPTATDADAGEPEAGDETEPATAEEDEATEAAEEVSHEPLRVMLSTQYDVSTVGADAALALGTYDERGLEVEVFQGEDVAQALAAGDADIGKASPNRFIGAILAGAEYTIVGPTYDVWGQYMIVRSDLGVESVEDLEGGTFGISAFGSAGHYTAEAVARQQGWDEGQYELVTLGGLDGLMAGLRSGTIDGFGWGARAAFTLEAEGVATIAGFVNDPAPKNVLAVANSTLEERPETVRAFCEAFYDAQQQFRDDLELALDIYVNQWDFDEEEQRRVLEAELPYLSVSDELTQEQLDQMAFATTVTIDGVDELTGDDVAELYIPCSEL